MLTEMSKLKDFSRSQAITCAVKVVISEKWCPIETWLLLKMHDLKMRTKLQDYFVFSVTAKFLKVGLQFTPQNLNSNSKHHDYELKCPCTRSVLRC